MKPPGRRSAPCINPSLAGIKGQGRVLSHVLAMVKDTCSASSVRFGVSRRWRRASEMKRKPDIRFNPLTALRNI